MENQSYINQCAVHWLFESLIQKELPTDQDRKDRKVGLNYIQHDILDKVLANKQSYVSIQAIPFGSYAHGVYAKHSDIDVSLEVGNRPKPTGHPSSLLSDINRWIQQNMPDVEAEFIHQATVPVLKLQIEFPFGKLKFDLTDNNFTGVVNSELLRLLYEYEPQYKQLVLLVKRYSEAQKLTGGDKHRLNSYTIQLLVMFFLQQKGIEMLPPMKDLLPPSFNSDYMLITDRNRLQEVLIYMQERYQKLKDTKLPKKPRTLPSLLKSFFRFYVEVFCELWFEQQGRENIQMAQQFGYKHCYALVPYHGFIQDLERRNDYIMNVYDPCEPQSNTARTIGKRGNQDNITTATDILQSFDNMNKFLVELPIWPGKDPPDNSVLRFQKLLQLFKEFKFNKNAVVACVDHMNVQSPPISSSLEKTTATTTLSKSSHTEANGQPIIDNLHSVNDDQVKFDNTSKMPNTSSNDNPLPYGRHSDQLNQPSSAFEINQQSKEQYRMSQTTTDEQSVPIARASCDRASQLNANDWAKQWAVWRNQLKQLSQTQASMQDVQQFYFSVVEQVVVSAEHQTEVAAYFTEQTEILFQGSEVSSTSEIMNVIQGAFQNGLQFLAFTQDEINGDIQLHSGVV